MSQCIAFILYLGLTSFGISVPLCSSVAQGFLRCFRDPIRVLRVESRVPRIRENYHWLPRTRENRAPRIREIGSLQIHTEWRVPNIFLKKNLVLRQVNQQC